MWKSSYIIRKYRRFLLLSVVIFLIVNLVIYRQYNHIDLQFDEVYEGTFRGKYLKTINDPAELKTDNFYTKWSLVGYLDDLVNEPIEEPNFENSIDPYSILDKNESANQTFVFSELPLLEKVRYYSDVLLPSTKYTFNAIQDIIYKDAYYSKKFINTRLKKWLKIKNHLTEKEQSQLEINDDWFQDVIVDLREKKLEHNLISANEIKYSLTHFKIFASLFLESSNEFTSLNSKDSKEYISYCSTLSKKLFNWLSGETPIFTKYDKKLVERRIKPLYDPNLLDSCFIKSLQTSFSGRGIVFTSNDALVPELAASLSLLRITGNTYPIEIFHNNDLSLESIKILNDIATDPIMKLPKSIPEFKVPKNPVTLDLTFVDVSNTISFKFKKYYSHFGMKLLAYLFNSFEEMIMIDTDTVIVAPIESFFDSPKYREHNAYFFKDRDANSFLYEGIVEYFRSYLNYDHELHYLGLPRASEDVLRNRFFGGMARHFMESGLFVINKKEKFDGVVISVILQMFKLFSGSLHGEKEFIWLGQEIMGQPYTFNSHPAIAIGELSPDRGLVSKELCSTHPAHIDDDLSLLWFNSGFLTCKKPESYYKDINYERNKGKKLIDLKKEYLSPLHITNGLIPPPAEFSINSNNGEPTRGWAMTSQCSNYLWCSYDIIGGGQNMNIPKGQIIDFPSNDVSKWDYLGRLWVNYFNIGYLGVSDHGYVEGDAYDELGLDDIDVFKTPNESDNNEDNEYMDLQNPYTDTDKVEEKGNSKATTNKIDMGSKSGKNILDDDTDTDILNIVDEESGISKDFKEDYDGKY